MSLNRIHIWRCISFFFAWTNRLEFFHSLNFFEVWRCFNFSMMVVGFYIHVFKTVFCFNSVCNLPNDSKEGVRFLFIFLHSELFFKSGSWHIATQVDCSQTCCSLQTVTKIQDSSIGQLSIGKIQLNQVWIIFNKLFKAAHNFQVDWTQFSVSFACSYVLGRQG